MSRYYFHNIKITFRQCPNHEWMGSGVSYSNGAQNAFSKETGAPKLVCVTQDLICAWAAFSRFRRPGKGASSSRSVLGLHERPPLAPQRQLYPEPRLHPPTPKPPHLRALSRVRSSGTHRSPRARLGAHSDGAHGCEELATLPKVESLWMRVWAITSLHCTNEQSTSAGEPSRTFPGMPAPTPTPAARLAPAPSGRSSSAATCRSSHYGVVNYFPSSSDCVAVSTSFKYCPWGAVVF